ncbi:unnamed protein product, partial [Rotaria sp. Silwood1]
EDIDGATVLLLQQEDIVKVFPRIKDRVKFVDERKKLIENFKEHLTDTAEITGNLFKSALSSSASSSYFLDVPQHDGLPNSSILVRTEEDQNEQTIDVISSNIDCHDNDDFDVKSRLPIDYTGPNLSAKMQYYIDKNDLSKFYPHSALRAELLSLLFDDVNKIHQLLYPNHDEYIIMAKCIVQKLSIPAALVREATKEWHESIKQKFKRERRPLQMDNDLVKHKQIQYGNGKTNGRPKRKSVVEQAERRTNDVPFINLNDVQNEYLLPLTDQMKIELRRDNPDNNVLHKLWRQSFNTRRLHVRELPIDQLLEQYPGYRRADLLLAEVKETIGVDLNENVEDLLPKFFECLPDNNYFLSDVLPIRVIRILCKKFGDSVSNVFTYQEVLVPYPCIKILEHKFEIYLDFHLVTETNSCSTALALLLSFYYIFEIQFAQHSRCCRFLYSILFEDARYLNKSTKNLLNSWKYKIINKPLIKRQAFVMNTAECFTQPSTDNENILSSSNNFTQIDHVATQQSQQTQCSLLPKKLTTSNNTVQDSFNSINENDHDQTSDSADKNIFNHLSPISISINDSQRNSPMILQNESQSSIDNQTLTDDLKLSETNEIYHVKNPPYSKQNELEPDPSKEKTTISNLKRKRKHNQPSSSSINFHKQSMRLGEKRSRVQ